MSQVRVLPYAFGDVQLRVFDYDFLDEGIPPTTGGGDAFLMVPGGMVFMNENGNLPVPGGFIDTTNGGTRLPVPGGFIAVTVP